jgi:hypothetical protein
MSPLGLPSQPRVFRVNCARVGASRDTASQEVLEGRKIFVKMFLNRQENVMDEHHMTMVNFSGDHINLGELPTCRKCGPEGNVSMMEKIT